MKRRRGILHLGLVILCSLYIFACTESLQKKKIKEADEFELYVFIHPIVYKNNIQVYIHDSLLYKGDFIISDEPGSMYISNLKKDTVSNIRLISNNIDTIFSLSTTGIDSILIGIPETEIPVLFDNHVKGVWLID